ncbi:M23 family metallopeptidase [Actinopolymorpha pittospori]|uniref:Murein DD-endopeptidase MepM/ murein hydrolase activator NlpD n=1 Tax=Actinopolymorpha pittospori TaxID=648752 RepID=A0A927MTP9_9ACTN|nr:M23 family metallopeptidase [Actinopolymorpha pittospori]MBE1606161.1 murein DD-endopeptidase MepM/ murein hydrolase activator NlpD [Actinopolymorpha pittospori]
MRRKPGQHRAERRRGQSGPFRRIAVTAGAAALVVGAASPWVAAYKAGRFGDATADGATTLAADSVGHQVATSRERERDRASRSYDRHGHETPTSGDGRTPDATGSPTPTASRTAPPTATAKPTPTPHATKAASKPTVTAKAKVPAPARTVLADGRPNFQLPVACGTHLEFTTYAGHAPEDKKIDFFNEDGETRGTVVRASAAGVVSKLSDPGGVKLDHGNGWYTLYLHMEERDVQPGQKVALGQRIGLVGSVGTGIAHLHYEQIYDSNHDGWGASPGEITNPVIQGVKYALHESDHFPVVASTNSC